MGREWVKPDAEETLYFMTGEALIAVDALQSLDIKNHSNIHEWNPLLGRHPSDGEFLLVETSTLTANALGFYYLPQPWRTVLGTAVLSVEGVVVARNFGLGLTLRL